MLLGGRAVPVFLAHMPQNRGRVRAVSMAIDGNDGRIERLKRTKDRHLYRLIAGGESEVHTGAN